MQPAERSQLPPGYRADIDGLRALSVIAVILFHAELAGFSGGFVGVDVFFVISGFLITRQLVPVTPQVAPLGLGEFYLRRARRILPALIFMLLVTTAAAVAVFTPAELRYYGEALRWCAAMLGNYAAFRFGNYFEPPWSYVPLRHLWSIGVEEQFYLFYPLLMLLLVRWWPKRLPAIVLGCALVSFALCVWASDAHPVANYFVAPSRAWQLLAGACVALGVFPRVSHRMFASVLAALSLLMLLASIVFYRSGMPWPGWYALPPCIAAVVLLSTGSGEGTAVHRALAWRPLVFIGLISYSLYLWHAPVQIFWRYYLIEKPGVVATCAMLAATLLIAVASWAFIEKPIRRARVLPRPGVFVSVALGLSVALVATGHALWNSSGLPQRFSAQELRLMREVNPYNQDAGRCLGLRSGQVLAGELCRYGAPAEHAPRVVLWGDSHAWMLVPAFDRLAAERGMQLLFAGRTECRPLTGVRSASQTVGLRARVQAQCEQFNEEMLVAMRRLRPEVIVLAAYWNHPDPEPAPTNGARLGPGETGLAYGIEGTVRELASVGSRVCVVLDIPWLPYSAMHALSMAERRGIGHDFLRVSRDAAREQQRDAATAFGGLAAQPHFRVVDPSPALCDTAWCRILADDGTPLYSDSDHLTLRGAQQVAAPLASCLDP